jgi:O-antigen/teichoic acid export membrane protein
VRKTQYVTIASMIGAVVNIVLNYIFINIFGFAAAGFTSLFCYILFMLLHYLFMRKVCKKLNREYKIYNTKFLFLFGMIVLLMIPVFMVLYNYIIIRYILILLMFILAIIFRNKIISIVKSFLKKEENKEC